MAGALMNKVWNLFGMDSAEPEEYEDEEVYEDEDEELEFVTTQYILYSLDDSVTENKTIGKIETYFNINDDKLVFDKVEINI